MFYFMFKKIYYKIRDEINAGNKKRLDREVLDKNITVNTYQYKDQVGSTSGTSEITPPNTGVVETPNESNQAFYLSGFALLALFLLKKRYEG